MHLFNDERLAKIYEKYILSFKVKLIQMLTIQIEVNRIGPFQPIIYLYQLAYFY